MSKELDLLLPHLGVVFASAVRTITSFSSVIGATI